MEKSNRDRKDIKNKMNTKAKSIYNKNKNSEEYKIKIAEQRNKRDKIYIDRYWMTYKAYWHMKNKEKIEKKPVTIEQKRANRLAQKKIRDKSLERYKSDHNWLSPWKVAYREKKNYMKNRKALENNWNLDE